MSIDLFKVYFKVKINTFKIKIEKCTENRKNKRKHVNLIHARIRPAQIKGLIMRSSCPRPTKLIMYLN